VLSDPPRAIRTIRPDLPAHLEQALLVGLAKVPADRPASAKAFLELLARSTPERPHLPPRWIWWTAGAAAAAIVVVVKTCSAPGLPKGMVLVPAGLYRVGGGGGRDTATVRLDSFYIDSTEVTVAAYQRWLPLINYENRQCGLSAAKVLMQEGGVIRSEMTRHPVLPLHPATRAGLIEVARRTDPLVLRWSR